MCETNFLIYCIQLLLGACLITDFFIVRHGWTTDQMKKNKILVTFLLPPFITSIAVAVPPLFYDLYNPIGRYCTVVPYPFSCFQESGSCIRGENGIIVLSLTYCYVFVCNLAVIVFMGLLVFSVYSQEKKIDQYMTEGEKNKRDTAIKTAWQGVRYAAAITIPNIPPYIYIVSFASSRMTERGITINRYLAHMFTPLVGFFNGKRRRTQTFTVTRVKFLNLFFSHFHLACSMCLFLSQIQDSSNEKSE